MTNEEKLAKAMDLLNRASEYFCEDAPDAEWFYDLFTLTGEHMIRTDEGWCSADCKESLLKDYPHERYDNIILDEVNSTLAGGGE